MTFTLSDEDIKRCRQINLRHTSRVKEIALAVSAECAMPISAIYGASRSSPIVAARQLVMYLARQDGMPYDAIGRALNKNHTTVMDAVRRETERRAEMTKAPE
jgi:chromosomal replication initiation ATPase DnaA